MDNSHTVTLDDLKNHPILVLDSISRLIKAGKMTEKEGWGVIDGFIEENVKELRTNEETRNEMRT